MVPEYGPLPSLTVSEVRALGLYRVYTGYLRGPLLRAHTKGPCNYPKPQDVKLKNYPLKCFTVALDP